MRQVVLYTAEGCGLCERALEVVREVQVVAGFDLEVVDIAADPKLEARFRERLPVVEIDGQAAFTYFVDAEALRRLVAATGIRSHGSRSREDP